MTTETTGSLWHASDGAPLVTSTAAIGGDCDLLVIGGGFTGCSAALEAARSGARVTLFEARSIGHGGSGRNVGLVNAGLWLPPDQIIARLGETAGTRLLNELADAPQAVFDIIAREGIDCAATRTGTLHLAHAPSGLRDLQDRLRQGNRLGAPLQLLDRAETARRTGTAAFHGALHDPRAGTIQPLAYCRGLARAAIKAGAIVHENAPVTGIARSNAGWEVTVRGRTLRSRALLIATNAYHSAMTGSPAPACVGLYYSQFATGPLPSDWRHRILPGGEGGWDTALVMTSLRVDAEGRLILGGMGDADGPAGRLHARWARRKLRALFPDLADLPFAHRWSGRIAMTSDKLPRVLAFGPDALSVYGYSGRGIAPGTVFGRAAARALLQNRPDALPIPVTQAHREPFAGLRAAYYETGAALTHAVGPAPLR